MRNKAYSRMYGGLIILFRLALGLRGVLPNDILGVPRFVLILTAIIVFWFLILIKLIPKCSKCGMGMFSIVELGYFPVILKPWVGTNCAGCGESLK